MELNIARATRNEIGVKKVYLVNLIYLVYDIFLMALVRVSENTKEMLVKYAAELQGKLGGRITLDEAIRDLLKNARIKDPLLLAKARIGGRSEDALKELYRERKMDEERARRRLRI
jgi:hypothetical protein